MMKSLVPLLAAGVLLAGCGGDTARNFGLTRDAPDEFQVTTRAPLSMPPSLGNLPTPRPGAVRPQEMSTQQQAESALVPGAVTAAPRTGTPSSGERALLSQGGPSVSDSIRDRVDEESLRLERTDRNVVDRVLFWREQPPPGTPVDAARESQRLRENAALGRPVSDGQTPVIQPQRRGLFTGWSLW
nr:DUF3035 domain-containing protein [uncultured Roseococcus sp.]